MTRPAATLAALVAAAGWCLAADAPEPLVRALGDRILECRHEASGALFMVPLEPRPGGLVPYFSHFEAYGLLRAYEATRDERYLAASDAWIDFYRARMRPDGTVTDFTFADDDRFVSTGDMDSTDSYAAMYLWVVAERVRVAGDEGGWLSERELSCYRALSAVLLTMQGDGLTLAKPGYPIEYLMDNSEVIIGLRSAAGLFGALGDTGMANHSTDLATRAEAELRTFYDRDRGYYAWYRDQVGDKGYALDKWYPDVMAQVLFLMWVGRPEGVDVALARRLSESGLVPAFGSADPGPRVWLGLAAQRVGLAECAEEIVAQVAALSPEEVSGWDGLACGRTLELLTGGTRPVW
jgi:hypothetical protein